MKPNSSNLDGSIEHFDAVVSNNSVGNKYFDQDNFYPACGCSNMDGVIENFDAVIAKDNVRKNYYDQDNFYPANGLLKGKRFDFRKEKSKARQARKDKEAETQRLIAKGIGKGSEQDLKLLSAINTPVEKPKGMSTGAKIAIGLGVATVLGIATYFIVKYSKK